MIDRVIAEIGSATGEVGALSAALARLAPEVEAAKAAGDEVKRLAALSRTIDIYRRLGALYSRMAVLQEVTLAEFLAGLPAARPGRNGAQ